MNARISPQKLAPALPVMELFLMETGDCALVVNDQLVASSDPAFVGENDEIDLVQISGKMAKVMGATLIQRSILCPEQSDWNWSEIIEKIVGARNQVAAQLQDVPVKPTVAFQVSLDDGVTFFPLATSPRIIVTNSLFDENEQPQELHLNVTTEGVIADLVEPVSGEVVGTACYPMDSLVDQDQSIEPHHDHS